MLKLKLGKAELSIRYGYEATVRSGIIPKLTALSGEDINDRIDVVMELLPELILVGVQKFHKKEYGYDYKTGDGKDIALGKIYELLDDYFDGEESNFTELLESLQNELMENSFLAKMFNEEVKRQEKSEKSEN